MSYLDRIVCWLAMIMVMAVSKADAQAAWSSPRIIDPYINSESSNNIAPRIVRNTSGTLLSVRLGGYTYGSQSTRRIIATNSTDNGLSWSTATLVNTAETSEQANIQYSYPISADIVYAGDNKWVCQWISSVHPSSKPSYHVIYTARSMDNGNTWQDQFSTTVAGINEFSRQPHGIRLASNGGGTIISTWTEGNSFFGGTIRMSRSVDYGKTWSFPAPAENTPAVGTDSRLAYSTDGLWYHAYSFRESSAPQRYLVVARSYDDGNTWTSQTIHAQLSSRPVLGDIKATGDSVMVAYMDHHPSINGSPMSTDAIIRYSTDAGENWSAPHSIGKIEINTHFSLAPGQNESWVLASAEYQTSQVQTRDLVIYQTQDPEAGWTSETLVTAPDVALQLPEVINCADNSFLCLYEANASSSDSWKVRAINTTSSTIPWTYVPFPNEHAPFYYNGNSDQNFYIGMAVDGALIATWDADVDAQRQPVISRSQDEGATWTSPELLSVGHTELRYLGSSNWLQVAQNRYYNYETNISTDNGVTWLTGGLMSQIGTNGIGTVIRSFESLGDYYLTISGDYGLTWGPHVKFPSVIHSIAHSFDTTWYIRGDKYYKSVDNGRTWVPATVFPELSLSDHRGNFVTAYSQYRVNSGVTNFDIMVTSYSEDTKSSTPVQVLDTAPTLTPYTYSGPYQLTVRTVHLGGDQ